MKAYSQVIFLCFTFFIGAVLFIELFNYQTAGKRIPLIVVSILIFLVIWELIKEAGKVRKQSNQHKERNPDRRIIGLTFLILVIASIAAIYINYLIVLPVMMFVFLQFITKIKVYYSLLFSIVTAGFLYGVFEALLR